MAGAIMSSKNPRSDFFANIRHLIYWNLIDNRYMYGYSRKNIKRFWQHKFKQQLYIEMSRVVVDDKMYMITAEDGVLAEFS